MSEWLSAPDDSMTGKRIEARHVPGETKHDAARRRIMEEAFPRLMILESRLKRDGYRIVGAILPAHLDPGPYDGADADPNQRAEIMGLPVTWGDRLALIVDA